MAEPLEELSKKRAKWKWWVYGNNGSVEIWLQGASAKLVLLAPGMEKPEIPIRTKTAQSLIDDLGLFRKASSSRI